MNVPKQRGRSLGLGCFMFLGGEANCRGGNLTTRAVFTEIQAPGTMGISVLNKKGKKNK